MGVGDFYAGRTVAERVTGTVAVMSALRIRDVRLLVGAVGLSSLGDFALAIPLALELRDRTGSALAVAAFFVCLFGPIVVCAAPAGRLVDRVENRTLLMVVSLLQAAAALALLAGGGVPTMLGLTAVIGAGVAVAAPAEFSLLPVAAGEANVAAANGQVESARYLGMTAGPVLGGVLAGAGLLAVAIVVNVVSFLAVALAAQRLRTRRRPERHGAGDSGRARDGVAVLLADRTVAIVLTTAIGALAFFSISMSAELFFVTDVLHAGDIGYGVLLSLWTAGMVLGATTVVRRITPARLTTVALAGIALQGAGLLGASLAGVLGTALIGFALGGVAHGVKNVVLRTLIHRRVPDALRGRAFAGYNAARNAAELGAIGLGGVLVGVIGSRAALALSGAIPLVLALTSLAYASATTTTRRSINAHVQG
jgi:MFS family permease